MDFADGSLIYVTHAEAINIGVDLFIKQTFIEMSFKP